MPREREPKYKREAEVEREVLIALGRIHDLLILKNETGTGYPYVVRHLLEQALKPWGPECIATLLSVLQKHQITWGLGVGSPDLVGFARTADGVARAGGLELKRPVGGILSDQQIRYHQAARKRGAFIGAPICSKDDALRAVERWRAGELE